MSETTKNRLYLMITITNRVMGATHFLDFYRAFGAPVVFTALGRGTASNDVLSYLGLEATEKSVMFSVVTPAVKEVLMRELVDTMRIDRPGSGIAVCLHLSSVGGRTALNYLISGESDAQPDMTVKEEEQMNENAYQLIVAIANQGYTDTVMEAASAAGARGGTVIHARATDAGNTNKFFGMAISEEREMIFLVTSADKRAAIMQSIMEKAGAHTEAQTVTFRWTTQRGCTAPTATEKQGLRLGRRRRMSLPRRNRGRLLCERNRRRAACSAVIGWMQDDASGPGR